jgi:2-dehydro-3-deoxy-L-rhamnonate dehydrogenase (NAD+)
MNRFIEQTAIITGGARGIGFAIAQRLASEGAHVVLFDQLEETLSQAVASLQGAGCSAEAHVLDITDEMAVQSAIDRVAAQQGRIDVMVNSAGIVGPTATPVITYDYASFRKVVDVNLNGAFLMTKYVMPHMQQRRYGRVLLISSIGGKEGNPGMAGYAASKSGVMGLVKGIGKEYAQEGITVNGLAPAVIATPMNLDTDPAMLAYMTQKIPMGRLGTVAEAASLSAWIVSPEASFNTGVVFDLSGGRATF